MLVQGHEGVLRFFPVWPADRNARFWNLRAEGAFLVAAERKNGTILSVSIRSEKGRPCTVQNPWPGRSVQLIRNGKPGETVTGLRFGFPTERDEEIVLMPL
jgi:hypothetical protein